MESHAYNDLASFEDDHWWFVGRRVLIAAALCSAFNGRRVARSLDVGCGTGANAALLGSVSHQVICTDTSPLVLALLRERHPELEVRRVSFPEGFSAAENGRYGCILLADVLEHLSDDRVALARIATLLEPGGVAVFTVPAFPALWSDHDRIAGHFRRYTKNELLQRINGVQGLRILSVSYCNFFLFPAVALVRFAERIFGIGRGRSDFFRLPVILNRLLAFLFASERFFISRFGLPFGVSLLCVLEKVPEESLHGSGEL